MSRLPFPSTPSMPHGAVNAVKGRFALPPGWVAKFAVPEAQHTTQAHGESLEQLGPVRHAA